MTLRGWTGSALAVGVAAAAASCGAGEPPQDQTASSPPVAASAPRLAWRSETREFRDWWAACDNGGGCFAFGFAPEVEGGWVRVALEPGPDARPEVTFGFWPAGGEAISTHELSLVVDGGFFSAQPGDGHEDTAVVGEVQTDTGAVIDALARGETLLLRAGTEQAVSLSGASAALLWIDEKQGRLGTTTALIRKGGRPASAVPPAPSLPRIVAGPAADQTGFGMEDQTLPASLLSRAEVKTCLEESGLPDVSDQVMSARLDDHTELWAAPCGSGAYNLAHYWYLTGSGGRDPRPLDLLGADNRRDDGDFPDNGTINGVYDPETRTIEAFSKGRGLGDCGALQTWTWTGRAFVLSSERFMTQCVGTPAALWPTTWRTQ